MVSGIRLARDAIDSTIAPPPMLSEAECELAQFRDALCEALARPCGKKTTSPRWFYDHVGSELFERITALPEYYPTRSELALLSRCAAELASYVPTSGALVEFGAGACRKAPLLLAHARDATFVPIDVCAEMLDSARRSLESSLPSVRVVPVVGDFTSASLELPSALAALPKCGFFPGSTIGNLDASQATAFLRNARRLLGAQSRFIVGVDLVKSIPTLLAAYDDAAGVTAKFNKNLLVRANRELGADFDVDKFEHRAVWNAKHSRIEMHLVSTIDQRVAIDQRVFRFKAGETLRTECCHKYTDDLLRELLDGTGWSIEKKFAGDAATNEQAAVALFVLRSD